MWCAGCMKGGSRTVKEHKWFAGMDWEAVFNGQVGACVAASLMRALHTHGALLGC